MKAKYSSLILALITSFQSTAAFAQIKNNDSSNDKIFTEFPTDKIGKSTESAAIIRAEQELAQSEDIMQKLLFGAKLNDNKTYTTLLDKTSETFAKIEESNKSRLSTASKYRLAGVTLIGVGGGVFYYLRRNSSYKKLIWIVTGGTIVIGGSLFGYSFAEDAMVEADKEDKIKEFRRDEDINKALETYVSQFDIALSLPNGGIDLEAKIKLQNELKKAYEISLTENDREFNPFDFTKKLLIEEYKDSGENTPLNDIHNIRLAFFEMQEDIIDKIIELDSTNNHKASAIVETKIQLERNKKIIRFALKEISAKIPADKLSQALKRDLEIAEIFTEL